MNSIYQNAMSAEELENAQRREKARRQGHDFIKIYYRGTIMPPPRVAEVQDIIPYDIPDPDAPGEVKTQTRKGSSQIEWERDSISGDWYYFILDCSYNRYWLKSFLYPKATHIAVELENKFLQREIEKLNPKDFSEGAGRKQEIHDQMRQLREELASINQSAKALSLIHI